VAKKPRQRLSNTAQSHIENGNGKPAGSIHAIPVRPDILRELAGGGRRSIGNADRVTKRILKDRNLLRDIIRGLSDDDPVIRMRLSICLSPIRRCANG
jgi:hypothetical protein